MRYLLPLIAFAFTISMNSQSVNDYKYAVVRAKYDFQKQENQHNMNAYLKMFMEKYGFVTFLDSERIPPDVALDNCNKLYVDVIENNTMMVTKLKVVMKDCTNKVLFTSSEGSSRIKEYKPAYLEALRNAFKSFDGLDYKYTAKDVNAAKIGNDAPAAAVPKVADQTIPKNTVNPKGAFHSALSAKRAKDGYTVFSGDTLVMQLFSTVSPNVFIAKNETFSGVLQKVEGNWVLEYYWPESHVVQTVQIDFQ